MGHTKTTLLILAAGSGVRYGKGIKQLERVGPSGEILMAYSIYDALHAGFDNVVIVIRGELEEVFRQRLGGRMLREADIRFIPQDTDRFLGDVIPPGRREKPWGTAHSLLCAKEAVDAPAAVINADDYYGKEAFSMLHTYLENVSPFSADGKHNMALISYILGNTLSDFGGVTRGICTFNSLGTLTEVRETRNITAAAGRRMCSSDNGKISAMSQVSMNMWGMFPGVLSLIEEAFHSFLRKTDRSEDSEFVLPVVINELLSDGKIDVAVLRSVEQWFGMTYREDAVYTAEKLKKLTGNGSYRTPLF